MWGQEGDRARVGSTVHVSKNIINVLHSVGLSVS